MGTEGNLRISQVGLRGIVGPGLTAAHVLDFAAAFGTFLDAPGKIVIGRDPRASGIMIREGVIAGLLSTGHDVIDLGVVSTPVIQHAIVRINAAGGISIGASHNAAEWNALKFLGPQGSYLATGESGELLDIYHLKKFAFVGYESVGKLQIDRTAMDLDEHETHTSSAPSRRRGVFLLPNLLWVQRASKREKLLQFAERVWDVREGSPEARAEAGIVRMRAFFESLGVSTYLSDYQIGTEHFEQDRGDRSAECDGDNDSTLTRVAGKVAGVVVGVLSPAQSAG